MGKITLSVTFFLLFVMGSISPVFGNGSHIKQVIAITEVFGDGQQVTAVALEYDKYIDNSKLSKSAFAVEGRTIVKAYSNLAAAKASQGTNGKYVILELSRVQAQNSGFGRDSSRGVSGNPDVSSGNRPPFDGAGSVGQGGSGPQRGMAPPKPDLTVSVTQGGDITTADGTTINATNKAIASSKFINLIVDDFKQLGYKDSKTGEMLYYNLYIPKNYDPKKSYPLVLFMHDASITGRETTATLTQGTGAVVWASPEEQAKHECFVLAPQYATQIVNDNSEACEYLDITVNLVHQLTKDYSININKMYTTGQSGGCMMSIAIDIKYPDLFAASFLVAGQWDATLVAPLAKQKIWIVVAEGDTKAFPGMNAITVALEKAGAKVSRATWNGRSSAAEFAGDVDNMNAEGNNIRYSVFKKGTVFPEGKEGGIEHMQTWKVAYNIEGIRDWLFRQSKEW